MTKKESSGLKGVADRAQDMVGGMVGMASATVGSSDAGSFVSNAALGNLYGLESSRIAYERSRSDRVKALAVSLIDDHTTADHQLKSTLRSMPDAPQCPSQLDDRRKQMVEHLRQAPDDEFDDRFLEQQVLAHEESLTLFQGFAKNGDDPRLRLFATASVPAMERHLNVVKMSRKH